MNIPSLLPCSSPGHSPSRKATVRSGATKADQSKLPHPLRTSNRQKSAPIIYNRSTAKFPLYHKFPISRQSGCLVLQPHDVILSMIFLNFQPQNHWNRFWTSPLCSERSPRSGELLLERRCVDVCLREVCCPSV